MPGAITQSIQTKGGFLGTIPPWRDGSTLNERTGKDEDLLCDLLERARGHDAVAFENLIAMTQKKAFGLAYHILGDYHQAQDVLQDAYIRAYRHIHTLKNPHSFRSWLARIVVNLSKEHFKSSNRIIMQADPRETPQQTTDVNQALESTLKKEQLREALHALSACERSTLLLRELYQMSYDEVAAVLKIPLGTVKSRLNEARKKLMDTWMRKEEEGNELPGNKRQNS